MAAAPDILCIGSVLWDLIGRAPLPMSVGHDVPGRIERQPGGVALNIAMTLHRLGLVPAILSSIGRDPEGEELAGACDALGLEMGYVHRSDRHPTDRYMAVEDSNGLIAAIADARALEAAGDAILAPLADGRLGSAEAPFAGPVAIDGNLTRALLSEIAVSPLLAAADLHVAPASPGKADRLKPFLGHRRAVLYLNLREAEILSGRDFRCSTEAAAVLHGEGAAGVCVTDGDRAASIAGENGVISASPPKVTPRRVTGAGDAFMAAHLAAALTGSCPEDALEKAILIAAAHVSGELHP